MEEAIISVKHFTKSLRKMWQWMTSVLMYNKGEIFGLLGPNGSGKTSTLESLGRTYETRMAGSLRVLGLDPKTQQTKTYKPGGGSIAELCPAGQYDCSGSDAVLLRLPSGMHHVTI